ncbi:hypothetical protein NEFER03_1033 [Nematocida sp. LUAm3]|nr:hypothetical protein NEFER03_1033 [Nematocida sp. LUAm3]KAI5175363.1 hypothetical protein NEFER02_1292 [Nematocida sp. LUAm2]KAI5177680.1 hypothetical protein NEFER01_0904 [Nematocida sp. LUAm1]
MKYSSIETCIQPIEGIQTANKNIYSYFVKNDTSYYVAPEERYPLYRRKTDRTYIVVIVEYKSKNEDYTYKNNEDGIEMECLIGRESFSLLRKKVTLSSLAYAIESVETETMSKDRFKPEESFIGLVCPDGLNRVCLMNIIDSILMHSKFRGILVSPISLATAFGLSVSCGLVFNRVDQSVAAIDDNCIFESEVLGVPGSTSMYGFDVADEFINKEEPTPSVQLMNVCYMCGESFDISEFSTHFKNKHEIDVYHDLREGDAMLSQCAVQETLSSEAPSVSPITSIEEGLARIIGKISLEEREKKILSTVIYVTKDRIDAQSEQIDLVSAEEIEEEKKERKKTEEELEVEKLLPSPPSMFFHLSEEERNITAWKGLYALTNIEPSKDLWLTDKEWKSVGLRVLKEKVLFPI